MAATAILKSGSEDQKQLLLPDIAAGETIATLAISEESGVWSPDGVAMTAKQAGDGYRLNGVKSFVLDGHTADLAVVVARREGALVAMDFPSLRWRVTRQDLSGRGSNRWTRRASWHV